MDNITAPAIGARIATDEIASVHYPLDKIGFGVDGEFRRVTDDDPLPSHDAALLAAVQALLPGTGTLPAGAATDAKLELIRLLLAGVLNVSVSASALPVGAATAAAQEAMRALLAGTLAVSAQALPLPAGAATQATLASVLAKMIAAPATEGKQDAGNTTLAAIVTALAATLKTATTDSTGAPQLGPSGVAPIAGTFTAVAPNQYATGIVASTGISAALPASVGRGVWAMLEANSADGSAPGTITGSYVVQKSTNGGGKWRPLTVGGGAWATFTAYAYEPISSEDDAGSLYRIVCVTAPTSGTITYRLGHS